MSVNWVNLNGKGVPVPLPGEEFIFSSQVSQKLPATIQTVASSSGGTTSTSSKPVGIIECSNGYVYLSAQRLIYVAEGSKGTESTAPTSSSNSGGGVLGSIWSSFSDSGLVGPSTRYHVEGLGDRNFDNISIPLQKFNSARLIQPWVGPNGWAGAFTAVKDGGLEPDQLLWEIKMTFTAGGALEFAKTFEKAVRAAQMNQNHIDELPAYTPTA